MNIMTLTKLDKDYWVKELELPFPGLNLYTDGTAHLTKRDMHYTRMRLDIEYTKTDIFRDRYDNDAWMLTSYIVFLYRMTQDKDLLIGVNNKKGNLLPMRITINGTDTFKQVYELVSSKFEGLQESDLTLQDVEHMTQQSAHFHTIYGDDHSHKQSWLNWSIKTDNKETAVHVTYARHLFKEETIQKFCKHFQNIVKASLNNIDAAINSLSMLIKEDLAAYASLNDTYKELPTNASIPAMFESVVAKFPNHIALSAAQEQLSYEQLDRQSNKIANMLVSKGLRKGQFVSIFMERNLNTIVSLLGIIKAGGAYVPVDPSHPNDRNAYIIEDTQSTIILTQEALTPKLAELLVDFDKKPELVTLDASLEYSEEPCGVHVEEDALAYVIYTSGSTGRPKGALIGQQGVVNLAMATQLDVKLTEDDYILQYSTFSFDASVYDLFASLFSGSRLHLLSDEERFSIDSFTQTVVDTNATRIAFLPGVFFRQLAAYLPEDASYKYRNIKSVAVGGEALSGETVRLFQKRLQVPIVNVYGPTEITAVATTHIVDYPVPDDLATVYIGTPLANYELYIVDENNGLCPTCITGELLISSVGVGKGYLNHPEKTKEVFITDPITPDSGKKFYRSGDLVRLLPSGQVEYKGRIDSQVKIRGFRIEIGEIEDNLAKHEGVKDIAVIPVIESDGTKMLAAFYTSNDGMPIPTKDLVQFLSKKVPSYMVPKYINFVEEMPASPTGKIDRKKLGTFELSASVDDSHYEPPVTDLQREVNAAWEKALSQKKISIHDDFFEIGGYSLKILEILVMLKPSYPQLKINDFFVYPTIAKLSERIEELAREEDRVDPMADANLPIHDLSEYPLQFHVKDHGTCVYTQDHILLTGGTGYLGSHLLYSLLQQSKATIYCLVRASEIQEAYERLQQTMFGYFGENAKQLMQNRVVAIEGDLEKENLGLTDEVLTLVEKNIDSIIHCGADVKHFGESEHFARVNVESTNRLLAFAKNKPHMRFHFISTLGIPEDLALNGQWDSVIAGTGYGAAYVENVYTNSKLKAEKLVIKAGEEAGVAATVYRVGNLSCHSGNGLFQKNIDNNAFYRMLKAMLLLKKAPKVRWEVDITPINYAGDSITALALQEETVGRVFHICNPIAISYEDMVGYFKAYGYEITLLDWQEYQTWLLDPKESKDQTGLELAMAQLEGDGAKNSIYRYTCPQTVEYLLNSDVKCASADEQFFKKLIDYAVHIGYFKKPE